MKGLEVALGEPSGPGLWGRRGGGAFPGFWGHSEPKGSGRLRGRPKGVGVTPGTGGWGYRGRLEGAQSRGCGEARGHLGLSGSALRAQ